jgi:hypothetical protein
MIMNHYYNFQETFLSGSVSLFKLSLTIVTIFRKGLEVKGIRKHSSLTNYINLV